MDREELEEHKKEILENMIDDAREGEWTEDADLGWRSVKMYAEEVMEVFLSEEDYRNIWHEYAIYMNILD